MKFATLSLCVCECMCFYECALYRKRWIRHNRLAIGQFGRIWNVNFCKTDSMVMCTSFSPGTTRKCSLDFWLFTFDIITWLSLKQPKIIPKCRSFRIHYEFHLCKLNECHIHIINFTSIHIHFKNILMLKFCSGMGSLYIYMFA